ncbi:unnamed protein product [Owenia fusiformis]|uniref:Uncharacterized protein n=2 Tax=Owenia fusiformis TaxID=6347 RepID=A0A8J1U964_OWEFU|nr:unnamed protein product [Owenia fusiformis]
MTPTMQKRFFRLIYSAVCTAGIYVLLRSILFKNPSSQREHLVTGPVSSRNAIHVTQWFNSGQISKGPIINCAALINADKNELEKSKKYMDRYPESMQSNLDFLEIHKNCGDFTKKNGYFMEPLTLEEKEFPIAFGILMYKDVAQTEFLLRTIYRPQNVYCIHLDRDSAPDVKQAMQSLVQCFDNVFIASKLEQVVYAGFPRLQADVNCMADLLKSRIPWKYYINLASQAFPLKTNAEIVKILKIYNGANDIEGIIGKRIHKWRFEKTWVLIPNPKGGKPSLRADDAKKSSPPHNIEIVRGSAYGIFSKGFVNYIVNNEIAKDLLEWSKDTYSPDEHYWATLHHLKNNPHLETPGGYKGTADEKPWLAVYASWGTVDPCHGKWAHGVCIFGVEDLNYLVGKRHELFANKFYRNYQYHAIECLAEHLYNRTVEKAPFDTSFYEKLPFIKP